MIVSTKERAILKAMVAEKGEMSGFHIALSTGETYITSVYVALVALETKGLVSSRKQTSIMGVELPRRLYQVTELGKQELERSDQHDH